MDIGFSSASQDGLQKKLILMCGLPGAGKTTTAHRIRQALDDAIVVSRDYIRNHKKNGRLDDHSSNGEITIVDQIYYADVEEYIFVYSTVILDATFKEYARRQKAFKFAQEHGCDIFLIECVCSYPILLQRLKRQVQLGYKKFNRPLEEQLKYYIKNMQEPQKQLDGVSFIQFDTEKNQVMVQSIQDHSNLFAKQLLEILKQPNDPSLLEPFCAISYCENGWLEEVLPTDLSRTKAEK
jgi:predicted kinase